jgi:hypothetical protein
MMKGFEKNGKKNRKEEEEEEKKTTNNFSIFMGSMHFCFGPSSLLLHVV